MQFKYLNEKTPMSADTLALYQHYKQLTPQPVVILMIHPETGELTPAEVPFYSFGLLREVANIIRETYYSIINRQFGDGSTCQCWRQSASFQEQLNNLIKAFSGVTVTQTPVGGGLRSLNEAVTFEDAALSKSALERKFDEIQALMRHRFGKVAPERYTKNVFDPPCPICGLPKELNAAVSFLDETVIQNLLNLLGVEHLPLVSVVPFCAAVYQQLYDANLIPETQKKMTTRFLTAFGIQALIDQGIQTLQSYLGIGSTSSQRLTTAASTVITSNASDGQRPMWTPDLRPANDASITTNTENPTPPSSIN